MPECRECGLRWFREPFGALPDERDYRKTCSQRSPLGSPASPRQPAEGSAGAIPQRDGKSL